jgi:ATP-binding cassette subfamily F protein 3
LGNYEDYLWRISGQPPAEAPKQASAVEATAAVPQGGAETTPAKRLNPIRMRQLKERCAQIEDEAARLEAEIAQLETALMVFKSVEETLRLTRRLEECRVKLDAALAEWEEVSRTLEGQTGHASNHPEPRGEVHS